MDILQILIEPNRIAARSNQITTDFHTDCRRVWMRDSTVRFGLTGDGGGTPTRGHTHRQPAHKPEVDIGSKFESEIVCRAAPKSQ